MDDEIGHVRIRLFRRADHCGLSAWAYMGRQLSPDEAKGLLHLWNDVEAFLKNRSDLYLKIKQRKQEGEIE